MKLTKVIINISVNRFLICVLEAGNYDYQNKMFLIRNSFYFNTFLFNNIIIIIASLVMVCAKIIKGF